MYNYIWTVLYSWVCRSRLFGVREVHQAFLKVMFFVWVFQYHRRPLKHTLELINYVFTLTWWPLGDHLVTTVWLQSGQNLTTFWLYSDYILTIFWLYSDSFWLFLTISVEKTKNTKKTWTIPDIYIDSADRSVFPFLYLFLYLFYSGTCVLARANQVQMESQCNSVDLRKAR